MSGRGGFGLMYRDFGYRPHLSLDESGAYDLVCGRPYCNLSREPRFYPGLFPLEHPFALLQAEPQRAIYPRAVARPSRAGLLFWLTFPLRLPFAFFGAIRFAARLGSLTRDFAARFRNEVLPAFSAEVEREEREDRSGLSTPALLERLEFWIHRTLYDFARDSLKPTFLAANAMGNLERELTPPLGRERAGTGLRELTRGGRADRGGDFAGALRDLAAGRLDRPTFLERFGHRGANEMELAQPRWSEDHVALDRLVGQAKEESAPAASPTEGQRQATWE